MCGKDVKMLDQVLSQTTAYLENMPKKERKKRGQFFTSKETAVYMASLFELQSLSGDIKILDPGAGTGILSAAMVERLQSYRDIKSITLVCYETDENVLPILQENLNYLGKMSNIPLEYHIMIDDYILSQCHEFEHDLFADNNPPKYDLIIANPPYLRVLRDHPAAMAMPTVVFGAPNLYFLFTAMSLFNLKEDAEMVYIIPRSWTSGAYFEAFRKYLFSNGVIENVHLFVSRDKVFNQEQVLQETIILRIKKTKVMPKTVILTSSQTNYDFDSISAIEVPYNAVVVGKEKYVFLPTSASEMEVIQKINRYTQTLPDIGFRMRTGIIVDFRQWDDLRKEPGEGICPLFYAQHIKGGRVNHFTSGKDFDWVSTEKPGLIQENKDYVFCKRFTAKEEKRRLQCGIYLAKDFPDYQVIGTQNKINFVEQTDKKHMKREEVYGIYALLNSTLFDMYYRILNGSTQVNSTEVNGIPVPPREKIYTIGKKLIEKDDLSTETCDQVLNEVAYG